MKLVSVVVTCYNQGDIILETLESFINQTHKKLEIIVVDDGSNDKDTIEVLKSIENTQKIKVCYKENNHVSSARNFGIAKARGEYIFISDGDDIYSPFLLERLVKKLEEDSSIGIASSWVETFGLARWIVKPAGGKVGEFLHKNNCPGQALIRRGVLEEVDGYDESMREGYEDWDLYLSITKLGWEVAIVEEPLIKYRTATSSLNIKGYNNRLKLMRGIIEKHKEIYNEYMVDVILRKEEAIQNKNLDIFNLLRSRKDLPSVTFGDGGMAFGVYAYSHLERDK